MNNLRTYILLALTLALTTHSVKAVADASQLIINEIQVANIDGFIDPSYNYGGWLEFYNPTDEKISLGKLYVSNDPSNLKMFQLPITSGTVQAHDFRAIWFDHYDTGDKYSTQARKQVNFKLDYEGGTIYISDADGNLLHTQSYPPAIQRCSYARTIDGGSEWRMCSTPTPAESNAGSTFADVQLPAPVVDADACLFTAPFTVHVQVPEGATLRYTTDGSTPTLTNGSVSADGLFNVGGSTAIYRFRLFRDGFLPSAVVTRSYIYKDREYYLPIVSVVTDDKNLFDNRIGAYTVGTNGITGNGVSYATNKNRSWERPVNFEYLVPEDDGGSFLMALSQECDFEVMGGWSRNLYAPNASFRLKGGKYYLGQNFLPYPFFKGKPYTKTKTLTVRNGGNDGYARIKDAAIHQIILRSGFYLDCQETQPAHVFINGKFYFTFNLREANNKNHGYSNYGIDNDEMDQFEINSVDGYLQKVGDDKAFKQWMTLAGQLASNPDDDGIYEQICQLVDIDEYCNYMAAECYVGCSDWLTNSNNVKGYRSWADGKFHLVFMDLDAGFSNTNMLGSLAGKLSDSRYSTGRNFLIDIFLKMMKYPPFRKRFIDAFCLVDGSVFEDQRSAEIINGMRDLTAEALAFEGRSDDLYASAADLLYRITSYRTSRMNNFRSYLGLDGGLNVELSSNVAGASILANGQEVPTGRFKGTLYAPMTLKAQGAAGYRFAGWRLRVGNGEYLSSPLISLSDTWDYYDKGAVNSKYWVAVAYTTTGWSSGKAPFGYGEIGVNGSRDYNTTLDYGGDAGNKWPTYYFRKSFQLAEAPAADDVFELTAYVDDGCVIYVNGREAGRYLMAEGAVSYDQYATSYAGSTAGRYSIVIDNTMLQKGRNVISVEVHNTSGSSSDIYWAAELTHSTRAEDPIVATTEELDLSTLADFTSGRLTATYEPLPDADLLANIATPLKLNEVSAGNSVFVNDHFKKNDWLEIYNPTDTELDVAGLYVSDNLNNPFKYQIPTSSAINTRVAPHGHLVVWADGLEPTTQLHAPFKLSNQDGESACIISSDDFVQNNASFFDAHPALTEFADAITYPSHDGDESVGRYPDGSNEIYRFVLPTIERANARLTADSYVGPDEGIMDNSGSQLNLELVEGWNWASHPFAKALPVSRFNRYADVVRGRSEEATYSPSAAAFTGSLRALLPNQLYKIEMSEARSYALDGLTLSTPATLSVEKGWNWIGFPSFDAQPLTKAFDSAALQDGDAIIGQAGFAVYSAADGWVGTLSSLMPGAGYMFKSGSKKKIGVATVRNGVRLRRPKQAQSVQGFDLNPYAYPDVMGVIASLQVDDQPVSAEEFTVVAYTDGVCRGVSECVDGRVFMTLYGIAGEAMTLRAVDEQGEEHPITEEVTLASDLKGTRERPVVWHIGPAGNVGIGAPAIATTSVVPIGYYSLSGTYMGASDSHLRPGFYIQRLSDGSARKMFLRK